MNKLVVLSIDDSPDDTLLLRSACERVGAPFELRFVHDGIEAISYFTGENQYADRMRYPLPHLVLLDLKMPCRNGFEVLDWLRIQPELKWLPVAVFTSSQHELDVQDAYQKGANCYLIKPVDYDQLVALVRVIASTIHNPPDLWRSLSTSPYFQGNPTNYSQRARPIL